MAKAQILEDHDHDHDVEKGLNLGRGPPSSDPSTSVMISGQEKTQLIPLSSSPEIVVVKTQTIKLGVVNTKKIASIQYLLYRIFSILTLFLVTGFLLVSYYDFQTDNEVPSTVSDMGSQNAYEANDEILVLGFKLTEVETFIREPDDGPIPLVLWHGMGDTAVGIKYGLEFISKQIPGIYIHSLQFGSNPAKDMENGYFSNVNQQVETACSIIKNDTKLANGFNAIGVSQGGQFMRALAQRCTGINIINLISLGGQHQGIFGVPKCFAPKQSWCEIIDKLLTHVAYSSWVQNFLVQAEYWHDPFNQDSYIQNSVFLADINNEKTINATYKDNLLKVKNLVLVKFENDSIVQPKESEWFGFYKNNTDKEMYRMEESSLYQQDKIGLKALKESGRLHLLSVPGEHLQFSKDWFTTSILKPFLM